MSCWWRCLAVMWVLLALGHQQGAVPAPAALLPVKQWSRKLLRKAGRRGAGWDVPHCSTALSSASAGATALHWGPRCVIQELVSAAACCLFSALRAFFCVIHSSEVLALIRAQRNNQLIHALLRHPPPASPPTSLQRLSHQCRVRELVPGLACTSWKLRTWGPGDKELLALSLPGSPGFAAQNGYGACKAPGSASCRWQRVWLVLLSCCRVGGLAVRT